MRAQIQVAVWVGMIMPGMAAASIVEGFAFKEGESHHEGITVTVDGLLEHPALETDATGHFGPWLAISGGWHTFEYSANGFDTVTTERYIDSLSVVTLSSVTLPRLTTCDALGWQTLPYEPEGSDIRFPRDEGQHVPYTVYPTEWWYANLHLVGESGRAYGAMVAFFKVPRLRIFTISDLDQEILYQDVRIPPYATVYDHWLDLMYCHMGIGSFEEEPYHAIGMPVQDQGEDVPVMAGNSEILASTGTKFGQFQTIPAQSTALPVPHCDHWHNLFAGGDPLPFQYHLDTMGSDGGLMRLDVDMTALKAPMLVGGTGLIMIGGGWSYYYSLPLMQVQGFITVHGLTERVTGYAWMDHQWGNFLTQGESVRWEWFAIQLNDDREIMVADSWVDGEWDASYSGGMNYYDPQCGNEILWDYSITPQDEWVDPHSGRMFATSWHITEPTRDIDLYVTALFEDQALHITPGLILRPPTFWEGACSVSGTIGGQSVQGQAFAELTHALSD